MYQENCPLTDEVVNIYADNIPAVEGTMLDVALPLRKQHFEVKKSDLFYSILDGSDRKNQKDYNDVLDVIPLVSSIKAEVGKIDIASTFELVLERPLEEVSEEANKPVFVSSEPEILDIDEEGNMTAKTDLGQTIVTLTWPSGVTAQILVTIGEVSEVKPYEPELGGDIVEPEQPEGGEDPDTPVDPNPEPEPEPEPDPEEPEEPEEPALMSRQLNPVVNTNSTDIITIENASYLYDETKCYLHVDCVVSQDYPDNTSLIYNLPLCNGEIWLNVNTDDITGEMTLLDNGDIRYSVDKLIFRNLNSFQRDGIENGDPNVELESIVGNKEVNGMNNLVSENMTNLEILDYQLYQNASNEYCMNIHITNHSPDVRYALYIDDEYAAEVAPNATKYIWHVLGPNMLVGDITCTEGINED